MTRHYILIENYEQGLALHRLLDEHDIPNRIAPFPRCAAVKVSCGMSVMLKPEDLEAAQHCLDENEAVYLAIIAVEDQLEAKRDRYC